MFVSRELPGVSLTCGGHVVSEHLLLKSCYSHEVTHYDSFSKYRENIHQPRMDSSVITIKMLAC